MPTGIKTFWTFLNLKLDILKEECKVKVICWVTFFMFGVIEDSPHVEKWAIVQSLGSVILFLVDHWFTLGRRVWIQAKPMAIGRVTCSFRGKFTDSYLSSFTQSMQVRLL